MIIEVWSDVVCPWCAIGRVQAATRRSTGSPVRGDVEVVLRSFELDPTRAGRLPASRWSTSSPRSTASRADEAARMMARTEDLAAAEGLEMHMETTLHSNTVDAHRLLHLALETGGPSLAADAQRRPRGRALPRRSSRRRRPRRPAHASPSRRASTRPRSTTCSTVSGTPTRSRPTYDRPVPTAANGVPFFVIDQKYGVSGAQPVEVVHAGAGDRPERLAGAPDRCWRCRR